VRPKIDGSDAPAVPTRSPNPLTQRAAPCGNTIEGAGVWKGATMKFSIYKDKAGEFRFRIVASNGNILASSQGYNQKQSAKEAIASIQKNGAAAEVVDET
jgi:uncharacterized protein YegP (UPF0339 family)